MAKRILVLLTAAIVAVSFACAQTSKRVLFIGNSYTEYNDLPGMVNNIARSLGDVLVYQSNTPGGCTFMQHCQNQSMNLIRQGGWDAVVLQEQSQYPSFPDWQVEQEVFPYAARLVDSIYAASPCAEPMFYMTWGRKNGDQSNAGFFPPLGTYQGMDSLLALRYGIMAEQNDASLCPVGRVWHWLRDNRPDIELYQSDESHPTVAGTYAAACSFYTMLFLRDPDSILFNASLSPEVAASIRMAVRNVVYDSLDRWRRPMPSLELTIPETHQYLDFSFSASLFFTDSLFVGWGDGNDTVFAASEAVTAFHTYSDTGTYSVLVSARRHCLENSRLLTYSAQRNPDDNTSVFFIEKTSLSLFPNPASDHLTVVFNDQPVSIELFDFKGNVVYSGRPNGRTCQIDISLLPAGVYYVRAAFSDAVVTNRFVIVAK